MEEHHELLKMYCLDGKRKIKVLRELWEEQDYEGYGIEVHALKEKYEVIPLTFRICMKGSRML